MRIPFRKPKRPETFSESIAKATIIDFGDVAMPKLRNPPVTLAEARALGERSRQRRLNGRAPS
jgi:hypothetical protein